MGWKHFHCLKYQAQLNLGSKAFAYSNIGKYFSQSKSKFLTFEIKGICAFSVNAGRSSSWCFLGSRTSCLTEHISKQMSTNSQCGTNKVRGTAAHLHKQDGAVVETSTLHLHRTGRYYGAAYSRLLCFQNLTIFAVFRKQEAC